MTKLTVLSVYNAYLNRGGEDEVFDAEANLLEKNGHIVHRLRVEADELRDPSLLKRARLAMDTIWSLRYYRRFRRLILQLRPDVVHFHNTFPLISPAAYAACKGQGVAVVQTLHNYRLICPKTTLFRDGRPCEDCVGTRIAWPGIIHACYHDSRLQTGVVAGMVAVHHLLGTWTRDVDLYVTPSDFARRKFIEGGLDPRRIIAKPNFIDPEGVDGSRPREFLLFVGRLVEDKGVGVMLQAWSQLSIDVPLRVIGDGPMAGHVEDFARAHPNVEYLGRVPRAQVIEQMKSARAMLFPSNWYETFGSTIVEAFACGLPVIASQAGPRAEMVEDGHTGLFFPSGDASRLAKQVEWAWSNPDKLARMGERCLQEYREKYTPDINYRQLTAIYEQAISRARSEIA